MKRLLFICSANRLRSPTAEFIFRDQPNLEVASAGLNHGADQPITAELVTWADIIFVMEPTHRAKLTRRFKKHLKNQKIVCLGIPDKFNFLDERLIRILKKSVAPHLK